MSHLEQHSAQAQDGVYEGTRKSLFLGRGDEKQNRSDSRVRGNETRRQIKCLGFVGGGGETPSWTEFILLTPPLVLVNLRLTYKC